MNITLHVPAESRAIPEDIPAVQVERIIIGKSVEGRPIHCQIYGRGPEVILILATIHGDETAGTPLVREMGLYLEHNPRLLTGRKVVVIPVANPDGFAHHTRTNVNGVDLNRNFAAANRRNSRRYGEKALSEPEALTLDMILWQYNPDRIVTIHQPLEVVDWDGPGEPLARHMGKYTDLPVRRLGARPGSLGAYAGDTLGIPIITLELPGGVEKLGTEDLWQKYGKMLLASIEYKNTPIDNPSSKTDSPLKDSITW
jgi:protein MpaA